MAEWFDCTIGDLCDTISDTYKGNDNKVVLVNTSDVLEGKVLNHTPVENTNLKGQFKKTFRKNDILFSEIRPANKRFAFVDFEDTSNYIASTKLMVLRSNDKVIPEFLFAILKSETVLTELQHLAETRSGTFPQITFSSELAPMKIKIPDKPTQRKIVSMLSSIEQKMESNIAINNNLMQQIQSLFSDWFVTFTPFGGNKPSSWNKTDIYAISKVIYGAPFASKAFNTERNGVPIIRIRDLKEQQFVTYTTETHPKGYLLKPGDVVVGMDGEFRPYIWGNDKAWLNQRVCVFENKRPNGKAFLYCVIKPLLYAIEQTQVGTTVIHIGKKDFDSFEFWLPEDCVLDKFDSITNPMYQQIVFSLLENKKLMVLRDTLLPKLLSGEINVSDIEL